MREVSVTELALRPDTVRYLWRKHVTLNIGDCVAHAVRPCLVNWVRKRTLEAKYPLPPK